MSWYKNLRTMHKLLLGFGALCLILGVVGFTGIKQLDKLNQMLNTLYERDMVGLSSAKEANIQLINAGRELRSIHLAQSAEEGRRSKVSMEKFLDESARQLAISEKSVVTEEGQKLVQDLREILPRYRAVAIASADLALDALQLQQQEDQVFAAVLQQQLEQGDVAAKQRAEIEARRSARALEQQKNLVEVRAVAEETDTLMSALAEQRDTLAAQAFNDSDVLYKNARTLLTALVAGGLGIGLLLGYMIAHIIVSPLSKAVTVLESVGAGDLTLTLDIDSQDELGQMAVALNKTVGLMHASLLEVRQASDAASEAAQELRAASEEISSGAQEQASGIEETAASLEEITSSTQNNADNAKQANQLALGAREAAERGSAVVGDAVSAMREIRDASLHISDIITVIDEISFQTNLLALNAAVEAARAGAHGRGFAVVAGEVRKLAQRSAESAKEIRTLISDSVRKVESGSELVARSGKTLEEIVLSVKRVSDIVAEIAAASREQASGIDQVNRAVTQMDQVTQSNAAQTEELSGTAEALAGQSEQLQAMVSRFKLDNTGHTAQARTKPKAKQPKVRSSFSPAAPRRSVSLAPSASLSASDFVEY